MINISANLSLNMLRDVIPVKNLYLSKSNIKILNDSLTLH